MINLRPDEQRPIAQYIHSLCGIMLDETKTYLIEGRLGHLVEEAGCATFTQFLARARTEPSRQLERKIIDAITTNETLFFRDNAPFELLRHKILPEVIDRWQRRPGARLRIWSAACSTGQEPYSIAIVLKELLGQTEQHNIRILATDISDRAVACASKGLYSVNEVERGLNDALRAKYFIRRGDGWQIHDELRAMVSFQRLNLLQEFSTIGKFDIIFCRNVSIYFSDADRRSLFSRLEKSLEPAGYLIIGAMESLNGACPQLESKLHLRSTFYQLKATSPTRGRGSFATPASLPGRWPPASRLLRV